MTGSPRTTGLRRAAAAVWVAAGLFVAGPVVAADWGTGSKYDYPGASARAGDAYGRQQGGAAGSYRPAEGSGGSWQAPGSGGSASSTWSPSTTWGQGGAAAWNGPSQGYRGPSTTGQADRPAGDYRFRQRPEDKSKKTDEGLRYRPDPELSRRSQQFWGVPGQDPSTYGGGPGVVFRPLHPEPEQSGKGMTGQQYRGDPSQPPLGGYPGAPYGYPY